jgi:hypothetical protein
MLQKLKDKRAELLREAEALREADGAGGFKYRDDAARAAFDAKMATVEALDTEIRHLEQGLSTYLRTENPLGGGHRTEPAHEEAAEPTVEERAADIETRRVTGILDACESAKIPREFARKLIDDKVGLLDAQTRIFEEMRKQRDPRPNGGPNAGARRAELGDDPFVHARAGIENALLHRVNPTHFKLEAIGREYRGMSMLDIAKVYLQARGERVTDLPRMEIAGKALGLIALRGGMHTTSDFPLLLADVANKSLRADYEAAPQTFMPFTRIGSVPDFKLANRVQIGDAPALHPVLEHGEFKRGTIEEAREQVQAATYGRVFAITRQALVNDDTDAFSRVPAKFGRMARNLESDLVYYQILKNANMNDGNALFSAAHLNYQGAGDISVSNVGVAEKSMLLQKGLDTVTLISVQPKYLLVPPTKKVKAQQFVSTTLQAATQANVNPYAGQLAVIVEPRLEAGVTIGQGGGALTAAGSAFAWYLVADTGQIDIIELVFLEGQQGPVIESRIGFDIDGLEIKCREDVGAKVIDYRGLYKSDGTEAS